MSVRLSELPIPSLSLDQALAKRAELEPSKIVLCDDADREQWIEGSAKVYTFETLEREITRYAKAFSAFQLPLGSVVALQMGLVSETVITVLALMRAGLKPYIIPLAWRRAEMVEALWESQVRALITHTSFEGNALAEEVRLVAQDIFSVRFVAAFGNNVPDGVLPLSDDTFIDDLAASGKLSDKRKRNPEDFILLFPEATDEGFQTIGWNAFGVCSASVLASVSMRLQAHHALCTTLHFSGATNLILAIGAMCFTGNALHLCYVRDVEQSLTKLTSGTFDRILVPANLLDEDLRWSQLPLAIVSRSAHIGYDVDGFGLCICLQSLGERAFLPAVANRDTLKCFKQAITTSPEILFCEMIEEAVHLGGLAHGYAVTLKSGNWVSKTDGNVIGISDMFDAFDDSVDRISLTPKDHIFVAGGLLFPTSFVESLLLGMPGVRQVKIFKMEDMLLGQRLSYEILLEPDHRLNRLDIVAYLKEKGVSPLLRPAQVYFKTLPQESLLHVEPLTTTLDEEEPLYAQATTAAE